MRVQSTRPRYMPSRFWLGSISPAETSGEAPAAPVDVPMASAGVIGNLSAILENTVAETAEEQAQGITYSAMQYTDGALADIQDILSSAIYNVRELNTKLLNAMSESLNRVYADRAQLHPQDDEVIANQAIAESEQRAKIEAQAAAQAALQEQQMAAAQAEAQNGAVWMPIFEDR